MKDQMKTKKQLIDELTGLRQRIIELEQAEIEWGRTEELLQRERETFFSVLHKAPYGVALIDQDGKFLYINSEFINITGYTLEDLLTGKSWFNKAYAFPEYRIEIINTWKKDVIQRGIEKVFTIICKEGEIKDIELKPTLLNDGKIIVMLSDITERKWAEESLRESEKKYRGILENIAEGYYEVDIAGNFTFFNDSVCQMLGYTRGEMMGMNNRQYTDRENSKKLFQTFNRVYRTGESTRGFGWEVIRKDGTIRFVESTISLIKDSMGQPTGFRGIVRDITERKRAEKELTDTKTLLEAAFEQSPIPMVLVSAPDNIIRIVNSACLEFLGVQDGTSAIGIPLFKMRQTWKDFDSHGKPVALNEHPLALALQGVTTRNKEYSVCRKDGTRRWELASAAPIYNQSGELMAAYVVFSDITESKQVEEAFRRSEEEANRLAKENAIVAEIGRIISSTLNIEEVYERFAEEVRKIISFDKIAINIIHHEEKAAAIAYTIGIDVIGRQPGDVFPLAGTFTEEVVRTRSGLLVQTENIEELKGRFPNLLTAFQAGLRSMISVPLISKDQVIGSLHIRSLKPNAYTESDLRLAQRVGNQIAGAIANAQLFAEHERSEMERAALQEELRQFQRMEAIGRLAGGISHDFNNLLTVISGNCQLSLLECREGDPLRGTIEEIKKAADRAASLTRQLLAFSRRQILEFKVLDLNTVLRDMGKMLHRVIGEDIELVTLLAEDLGTVRTDSGQIEQVIMNLAVNAKDAMPNGGKLMIETANVELDEEYAHTHISVKPGPYVKLSVSDTGVGMTPEVKERVFEPFFSTKEKGKGTGLGLSTVYGIVKQSGGYVWVYSELGYGTTFKIYLPQVDEPVEVLGEKIEEKEAPRGRETILLVEDEEAVRKLAVQFLRRHGYFVLEAIHGSDALSVCEQHQGPVHLMVTDVVMPGMSGRELAERLSSLHSEMKVLYMSGYTDNAIVHHGVLDEGMNYIQKPFSMEMLARKVREVLDKENRSY